MHEQIVMMRRIGELGKVCQSLSSSLGCGGGSDAGENPSKGSKKWARRSKKGSHEVCRIGLAEIGDPECGGSALTGKAGYHEGWDVERAPARGVVKRGLLS